MSQNTKLVRWLWYRLVPPFAFSKRLYGLRMLYSFRDHSEYWRRSTKRIEQEEAVVQVLTPIRGKLWDVGASVGLYSCVWMRNGGESVVAFELSPAAARYITRNAARNGIAVEVV